MYNWSKLIKFIMETNEIWKEIDGYPGYQVS